MRLLFATSSQWRRELFALYFPSEIVSSAKYANPDIDEKAIRDQDPIVMVQKIAEEKLQQGILKSDSDILNGVDCVFTFDQVVICKGQVREKPQSAEEARAFLKSYSDGEEAICANGIVAYKVSNGQKIVGVDCSTVKLR